MKKYFTTFGMIISLILCATQLNAQKVYMVTKGETSTPYYDLEEAIEAAEAGSTVYIPSGVHTVKGNPVIEGATRSKTILIKKKINLVGAGADEGVLHGTVIEGDITVTGTDANESYMTGFTLTGALRWDNVSGMILKRCKITLYFIVSGKGTGNIIEECLLLKDVINYKTMYSGEYRSADDNMGLRLTNNVLGERVAYLKDAVIFNNVFTIEIMSN